MREECESSIAASKPEWAAPFALDEDALEAVNPGALSTTSNYCQLDPQSRSIRLLTITWNQDLGEVECWTETCSLNNVPLYTALSYTWGSPDAGCKVVLDGRKIAVTKNLRRFLCHAIRLPKYGSRRYWIDALCIDQSNMEERSHQISMMPAIYSTASSVLVWLGPAYDSVEAARTMRALRRPYESGFWRSNRAGDIKSLCERRYWTRLWVVQELRLANDITILCGTETLPWNTFVGYICNAVANPPLWRTERDRTSNYEALVDAPATVMVRNVLEAQESARLFDLVLAFKRFNCADPRDRVYALLGITDDPDRLRADYSLSIVALLHDVLRNHHKVVKPQSLEEVRGQCLSLCDTVGLASNQMLDITGGASDLYYDAVFKHLNCSIDQFRMLPWGKTHSHQCVVQLWYREVNMHRNMRTIEHKFDDFITHGQEALVRISIAYGLIRPTSSHLCVAVESGNLEIAMILLQCESVDVNEQDERGLTPLSAAVEVSETGTRFLLKDTRVDVNKQASRTHGPCLGYFQSPLHIAIRCSYSGERLRVVNLLLDHPGIDVNCKDDKGYTPLEAAISSSPRDSESARIIERLLQDGRVVLDGLCFFGCSWHGIDSLGGRPSVEEAITASGTCGECTYMPSAFCAAIELASYMFNMGGVRVIRSLLTRTGLDINEGQPIHRAIGRGLVGIVKMLLARDDLRISKPTFSSDGQFIAEPGVLCHAIQQAYRDPWRAVPIFHSILRSKKAGSFAIEFNIASKIGFGDCPTPSSDWSANVAPLRATQKRLKLNKRLRRRQSAEHLHMWTSENSDGGCGYLLADPRFRYFDTSLSLHAQLRCTQDDLSILTNSTWSQVRHEILGSEISWRWCMKCKREAEHSAWLHAVPEYDYDLDRHPPRSVWSTDRPYRPLFEA